MIDPAELERLSKAATAPGALIADKGAFLVALETAYRTGQLVLAQPSGDVVEAVARAINLTRFEDDGSSPCEDDYDMARAAITTYEAVSGVAKMREALRPFARMADEIQAMTDETGIRPECIAKSCEWEHLLAARAALGEKP